VVLSPWKTIPNSSREVLPCGGGGNRWPKDFPVRDFLPWVNYHMLPN